MADLRLQAIERTTRLTNAETVRLGRLLTHRMGPTSVDFPDGTVRPVVVLRDCADDLPAPIADKVREVLGPFTTERASG